jgi:hypothetical protein
MGILEQSLEIEEQGHMDIKIVHDGLKKQPGSTNSTAGCVIDWEEGRQNSPPVSWK